MKKYIYLLLFLSFQLIPEMDAATRRYRLVWNDNPSTTMGFALEQYNDGGGNTLGNVNIYYGTSPSTMNSILFPVRSESERGMDNIFFKATGLTPNTVYYFYVEDGQTTSATYYFETASDDPTVPLSLVAGGDSRAAFSGGDQTARQNANKLVAKLRPHAVLFGGDFTNLDTDGEWQTWFDDWQLTTASDGRMTPIIPARGNHELLDGSRVYDLFNTPSAGSDTGDTYYALTLGGDLLRIYTLNSMISVTGDQATWLNNDLASTCAKWKMAQYHYPMRPHNSEKDEQDDQRSAWCPAFEAHGLHLAIESDSHLCKYTHPVRASTEAGHQEGFIRDDQDGVVYIGEGGWGATLRDVDDAKGWTQADSGTSPINQFKLIFVSQAGIDIRTVVTKNSDANYPDNIAELPLANRFTLPSNLDVWTPTPNGTASGILAYDATSGVLSLNNPNPTDLVVDLGVDVPANAGAMMTLDAGVGFETYTWNTGETTQTIDIDLSTPQAYSVTCSINGCVQTDVFYVFGATAEMGKTYEVDGDNLYIDECSDCSLGPDPRFRIRINDNLNSTWENWDKDLDNTGCEWLGVTNYSWVENRPADSFTAFNVELDAWESDDGFLCGDNDGICGGYEQVGTHVLCDLPPCDWHYFQAFRACTSGGETITWGLEYSYRYTFNDLDAGAIASTQMDFCDSVDPTLIGSTIDATQWTNYQWEYSTDGLTWLPVASNGTAATYDPNTISETTHFRRQATDCSGRERYSNVVVLQKNDASTPYDAVVDSSALLICANTSTTIQLTGGIDGTNATTSWYDDALLTNLIAIGNTTTTPLLTSNTTYYVVRSGTCNTTTPLAVNITVIPDYLTITDNPSDGLYQAGIQITTNGTVLVGTDATYKAGTQICLESGFEMPLGATFLGTIEGCGTGTTSPVIYSVQASSVAKKE